jgi:hypothetical protein
MHMNKAKYTRTINKSLLIMRDTGYYDHLNSVSNNNRKTDPRRITGYDDTHYNMQFTKGNIRNRIYYTIIISLKKF